MKRILVFSDTHGDIRLCKRIIDRIPCDLILHAGDYAGDAQELKKLYPDKEIIYVKGNCDMLSYAPETEIVSLGGVRIYLVHGHRHRVKYEYDYATVERAARENKCDVAVFGHTHTEYSDKRNGLQLLNPGSARCGGTYGVIEIENGIPSVCFIKDESGF